MIVIDKELFVKQPDGRVGIPSVFEYELLDGTRLPVPPKWKTHPDPEKHMKAYTRHSVPYKVIVHDRQKYDHLLKTGWVYGPEHWGKSGPLVDNRRTS